MSNFHPTDKQAEIDEGMLSSSDWQGPLSLCIVVIMYEGSEPCSQTMVCLMPLNIRSQERGNHFIQSARVIKPIWSVTCSFDINLRD